MRPRRVRKFARPKTALVKYPALPRGAFECRPWRGGEEPITAQETEFFRRKVLGLDAQMSPRERRRALKVFVRSGPAPTNKQRAWPDSSWCPRRREAD
jgi:hypothetical protein